MKKTAAVLALCLLAPTGRAFAIDADAGTAAGSFMRLGIGSARGLALGRAYSALAQGIDGMAWNPASIASAQQREVAFSHLSWVQEYAGNYAAYIQPVGQAVVGVNMAYLTVDDFDARDENNIPQPNDDVRVQDSFISVAVARTFLVEQISLGAAVKRVAENNDGDEYANVVFDLGAQVKLGRMAALGGAIQNIGNSNEVVQTSRVGAAAWPLSWLTLTAEVEQPSDNKARLGLGIEITLSEEMLQVGKLMLRAGYYDSDDHGKNYDDSLLKSLSLQSASKLSFGMGLYSTEAFGYGVGIDYVMVPFGSLGRVSQISARVAF